MARYAIFACDEMYGGLHGMNYTGVIEADSEEEVAGLAFEEALLEKPDRIMFDNFTPEDTVKAVQIVNHQCETESSGGITFDNMIPYAKAGVDFISFGALTHSVKGLDMSFKAV